MFLSVFRDQADHQIWHKGTDFSLLFLFQESKEIVSSVTLGLWEHRLNKNLVEAFIAKETQVSDRYLNQMPLRSLSTRSIFPVIYHLTGPRIFLPEHIFGLFIISQGSEQIDKRVPRSQMYICLFCYFNKLSWVCLLSLPNLNLFQRKLLSKRRYDLVY